MAASPLPSRGPKRGQNCYVPPAFLGVPNKGDKITNGCLTPAFSGAPEKARVRRPLLSVSPLLGTPRMQGLTSNSALFWAPEKAGVRQPFVILSPWLGAPRMQGLCSNSVQFWAPEKAGVR